MSVVIETTLGDITVDLYLSERPRACLNFLKLCKIKYYNFNLFHTISRGFIGQTGDPSGSRTGGDSIFGVIDGPTKRYFEAESEPRIKHTRPGLISFVGSEKTMIGSQFFLTLGEDLTYLDDKHCVFGEVVEGFEILEEINEVICDKDDRPYQDVRITHTIVLNDPYPDPNGLSPPSRSPSPSAERLAGGRIAPDEEIDENTGKSNQEIIEMQAEREAKARATILEMVGDIPDAEMAPPENVLFVCKLNPVTTDDDLEIIFSRFGKIKSCEVIRDRKSGDSLQYAFIEFEERKSCEDAYFKMGNVLIDDRRIHVDFSQSVSKVKWLGKGRGVAHFDEKGNKRNKDVSNDIGKGHYKTNNFREESNRGRQISPVRDRKQSPRRSRDNKKDDRYRRHSRSPKRLLEGPRRFPKRKRSRSLERPSRNISYRRNSRSPRRRPNWTSEKPVKDSNGYRRNLRSPRRSLQRPQRRDERNRRSSRSPRRSRSPRHSNQRRPLENRRSSGSPKRSNQKNTSTERPTRSQTNRSRSRDRKNTEKDTRKISTSNYEPKIDKSKKKKIESSEDSSSTESSSEEEKKKKKSKNKKSKKSKKNKKKYSSSSDSSSSSSDSDNKKTKNKKLKKK